MNFVKKLACLAFGLVLSPAVYARADTPLPVRFTLTHIAADTWRADYVLAEPVTSIELGAKAGAYRSRAWRMLTPGLSLVERDGQEALTSEGAPFSRVSIEVSLFLPYAEGNYTPFDRMSDGGSDIFLGFFGGEAEQGKRTRPLRLKLRLKGLGSETVIAPHDRNPGQPSYAYFGPAHPARAGVANLIIDPTTPEWMSQLLRQTTGAITDYYAQAFERPLPYRPLVMVSVSDFDSPGLSMKGGAVGQQVVYRVGGRALLRGSPQAQALFKELIAHELAHVWQNNVRRGGIGGGEPWVHEGGAEAIALAGLLRTGLISQADAEAYSTKLIRECEALKGAVDTYRGTYACGFKRFTDKKTDIFRLWKAMMDASEASGEVYSGSMIEAITKSAQGSRAPEVTGSSQADR